MQLRGTSSCQVDVRGTEAVQWAVLVYSSHPACYQRRHLRWNLLLACLELNERAASVYARMTLLELELVESKNGIPVRVLVATLADKEIAELRQLASHLCGVHLTATQTFC